MDSEPRPISEIIGPTMRSLIERAEQQTGNIEDARRFSAMQQRRAVSVDAFERRIGRRYMQCRLSNFECHHDAQRKAIDELNRIDIRSHVRGGGGLVLFGEIGTGKDHLLAAMLFEAANDCFSVDWINGVDLFGATRDLMDATGDNAKESKLLGHFLKPDVLAISDPAPPMGGARPFAIEWLFRVVDARYRQMKPTWVTVNAKDSTQASEMLSFQVVDRLKDNAVCIKCSWPSYRRGLESGGYERD